MEFVKKTGDNRKMHGYNKAITNDYELGGKDLPRLFNTTPPQKRAKGEINSRLLLFLHFFAKGGEDAAQETTFCG